MKLPKLTNKQQEIIELLYTYRFLNRIQIQQLMGHKDKKTINLWLRDLKAKEYIEWIYDPNDFALKTKPAIYYFALNGVRFLKTVQATDGSAWYPIDDVRKRYREASRSQTFVDHCMLVADCCITLNTYGNAPNSSTNTSKRVKTYTFVSIVDYSHPSSDKHFLAESELIQPDLCFTKHERKKVDGKMTDTITNYLLEVFDASMPRYRIKKRLTNYVNYLQDGEWEGETDYDTPPIVLLVCPRTTDLIYAKRRTRGLLAEQWDSDDEDRPHMRFTTIEKLRKSSVLGDIWEKA